MFSKKFLISLTIFALLLSPLIVWGAGSDYGLKETADAADLDTTPANKLPTLIGKIIGTGLSLVGVLFFALMLYGGLTWMLARGNSEQETKALETITAAIIGIVIVLASYAITNFVFQNIGPGSSTAPAASSGDVSTGVFAKCDFSEEKHSLFCSYLSADQETCLATKAGGVSVCAWSGGVCTTGSVTIEGKNPLISYCESKEAIDSCEMAVPNLCKWKN